MTWGMVNMGPFHRGTGSSSARKMWDLARMCPLNSLWNPESECAARTIFLSLYMIPLLGKGVR